MGITRLINSSIFRSLRSFLGLRDQRGSRWADLVEHISTLHRTDPQVIAFRYTIDLLRYEQGKKRHACRETVCAACAMEAITDFEGTEEELINAYYRNLDEIRFEMSAMAARRRERQRVEPAALRGRVA